MSESPLLGVPELRQGLEEVEVQLLRSVETDDPFLTEVASHLIRAGGKRLRPLLSLAASGWGSSSWAPTTDEAISGGVAVELVHLGSLYHDDVMDEAAVRRSADSVNARWGNLRAILAGDFLLARASEIAATLGTEVAGLLAATIARLCEGQVRELQSTFDTSRTEESYFASISGKTAALFSTATRIGGLVGSLPGERIDELTRFGHAYGTAFQIVDDVLDVVATPEQLGKPAGHDLVEGVYTLPVIRALAGPDGEELRSLLGPSLSPEALEQALALVRGNGSVGTSITSAREHLDEAVSALGAGGDTVVGRDLVAAAQDLLVSVEEVADDAGRG